MSIKQKMREEELRIRTETEARRQKIEELIQTNPTRLKMKNLVPIVQPILRELANETNLLIQKKENTQDPIYSTNDITNSLVTFEFWTKAGWPFTKPYQRVFDVHIGQVTVRSYGYSVTETAIKFELYIRAIYHDENSVIERYNCDSIPEQDSAIKAWFSDVLFKVYLRVKANRG